jgi:hypothetical protein
MRRPSKEGQRMHDWTVQCEIDPERDAQRLYALCGTRLYCVETLTGTFPDVGWHQPGEMGGIWSPPIKLLDGYWVGLRRPGGDPVWLTRPLSWQLGPDGATFRYEVPALGVHVVRQAWIAPDQPVLVIDVTITTEGDSPGRLECGVVLRSDLHGPWFSERVGWADGQDAARYAEDLRAVVVTNPANPDWMVCAGTGEAPASHTLGPAIYGPERPAGQGCGAALWYACDLSGQQTARIRVVVAGSSGAETPATSLFGRLLPACGSPLQEESALAEAHRKAAARFRLPFEQCVLESPDSILDEAFGWVKANTAWLQIAVPGMGAAPMGGVPDFPWWFGCDVAYGVLPTLAAGQAEDAVGALRTLATLSRRFGPPGRVAHEIITNGVVTESGNLVEVPLFARALYHTYRWTGDRALLEELFPFCLDCVLGWALGVCRQSGEEVPQGRSMAETPDMHGGVQTLDVAAYLAEALDMLADLAAELGWAHLPGSLRTRAMRIREHVHQDWWLPDEGLFGDMRASRAELETLLSRLRALPDPDEWTVRSIQRLQKALATDRAAVPDDVRRPWLFYYYVQALAGEAGLPTREQAERLLSRMETQEWSEEFGVVLNASNDRRIMSLPTGALACAEARYGRPDAALDHIHRLCATLGRATPGTIAEFSPDGGNFLQLWSGYGIIWPVVSFIFGLRPDAARKRLVCVPHIPQSWPQARLRDIPLGNSRVSIAVATAEDGEQRITVATSATDWAIEIGAATPEPSSVPVAATLNGTPVRLRRVTDDHGEQRPAWVAAPVHSSPTCELVVRWSSSALEARTSASRRQSAS